MNDNKTFLHCTDSGVILLASEPWALDKPANFMWMPAGVQTIYPRYEGKPIELTVNVTASTAKVVQASLSEWHRVRPNQSPFGCIEHREQEAAVRLPKDVAAFSWKDDGVYVTALPTGLGARNVNERIHASWSPSFTTDADYSKAKTIGKVLIFPKGVRGSRENPAEVTGCAFSVGSLTNKPAFRDIQPVKATEAEIEAAFGEAEDVVTAMWSDKAREAALEARKSHGTSATDAERVASAHRASANAYSETLMTMDESNARTHQDAGLEHQRAATFHRHNVVAGDPNGHLKYAVAHDKMADSHFDEHRKMFTKANKAGSELDKYRKAADATPTETLYASLAPDAEELKKVYARLSETMTPQQELYARLFADENAQTAGAK